MTDAARSDGRVEALLALARHATASAMTGAHAPIAIVLAKVRR